MAKAPDTSGSPTPHRIIDRRNGPVIDGGANPLVLASRRPMAKPLPTQNPLLKHDLPTVTLPARAV